MLYASVPVRELYVNCTLALARKVDLRAPSVVVRTVKVMGFAALPLNRGGVLNGASLWFVACSYAYPRAINRASSRLRPNNSSPIGSPRVHPAGILSAGSPVFALNEQLDPL